MKTTIRFLLTVWVSFFACLSVAQALSLSGTVYGGSTPMVGATVTLSDAATATQVGQVVSDANGKYLFNIQSGTYKLLVTPPVGSLLGAATINGVVVGATDTQQDVVLIGASSQLSGTITGVGGAGLPGVVVNLFASTDVANSQQLATTQTDASGHYSFSVSPGDYKFQLVRQSGSTTSSAEPSGGWIAYAVGHAVVASDTVNNVALPFAKLDGKTTDANGVAVGAVSISATGYKYGLGDLSGYMFMWPSTSVSDSQGNFSIVLYSGVDQSVTLTPPQGSALALTTSVVNLAASASRDLVVSSAFKLAGTITGVGGAGLPGVVVTLFASTDVANSQQLATTQTDASGHYSFSVSPGDYKFQLVRQSGSTTSSAEPSGGWIAYGVGHAVVASDTVNNVALPFAKLDGKTTDANGVAVGAVSISATGYKYGLGDLSGYMFMWPSTSVSDSQGNFSIVLYSGVDQSVTLTPPQGSALALTTSSVNLAASASRDLVVSSAFKLAGTITGVGGAGLPGVVVNLFASTDVANSQQLATTQTDASGHYSFSVSPGDYKFQLVRQSGSTTSSAEPSGGWIAYGVGHAVVASDTVNNVALPFAKLDGKTTDANGVAVGAVSISATGYKYGLGDLSGYMFMWPSTSVSDSQGNFSIVLYSGGADLSITPPPATGFGTSSLSGQVAASNLLNIVLNYKDTAAPSIISGPTVRSITSTSAVVEWQTDEPTRGTVKLGGLTVPVDSLASTHSVQITGLSPSTAYNTEVSVTDATGNGPTVKSVSFTTVAQSDVTPPAILEGPTVTGSTATSLVVEWTTSEPAKGSLSYGTGTSLAGALAEANLSVAHRVELTGLTPNSAYSVRVGATDAAGNGPTLSRINTGRTLPTPDTTPPVIVNGPLVSDITNNSATISWKTDEPSTGGVSWNDGVVYGLLSDDKLDTSHSARITGLLASKTYHLTVSSKDALGNGPTLSKTVDFTTQLAPDNAAPVITNGPTVANITEQGAVIQWDTDEPADSQVIFGTAAANLDKTESRVLLTKKHSVPLTGLSAATAYAVQVRSRDAVGNVSSYSTATSFTTSATPDTTLPVFDTPPAVGYVAPSKAVVQWKTDKLTDSQVTITPITFDEPPKINSEGVLKDLHEVSLTGLTPNKTYSVAVTSTDLSGNTVTQALGDFTTPPMPDGQVPTITTGPSVQASATTAIVTWGTDKLADNKASYGPAGAALSQVIGDIAYTKQHSLVLSKLQPTTAYQVQVASTDPSGNGPTLSPVLSFSTTADAGQGTSTTSTTTTSTTSTTTTAAPTTTTGATTTTTAAPTTTTGATTTTTAAATTTTVGSTTTTTVAPGQWLSRAPIWSSATAVAVDRTSGAVFVGIENNGVFKTTDGGGTWVAANVGLANATPTKLIVDSAGAVYALAQGSVYKTTDAGVLWARSNGISSVGVLALDANDYVYAGVRGGGLYKSVNGGTSWTKVDVDLPNLAIESVAVDASGVVYLSAYPLDVYKSTDGGVHWTGVKAGLPTSTPGALFADGTTLYAGTYWDGVYKSTDGGLHWGPVNTGMPTGRGVRSFVASSNGAVYAVAGDQKGGAGVYRTTDQGVSWQSVNAGLTELQMKGVSGIDVDALGSPIVVAGAGGVLRYSDQATAWQPIGKGGFAPTLIRALLADGIDVVYAASNTSGAAPDGGLGISKTLNGGARWAEVDYGLTNLDVIGLAKDSAGAIYASTYWMSVFKTIDGGLHWTSASHGLPSSSPTALVADGTTVYVGTYWDGVYKTVDGGANWTSVYNGMPVGTGGPSGRRGVSALAVVATNTLFAAVGDQISSFGIYKTVDGGLHWNPVNNGLGNLNVTSLLVDSASVVYAGTHGGVFRSVDGGDSWTAVNSGLANLNIAALALDRAGAVFAGVANGGVYKLLSGQSSWSAAGSGLADQNVVALAVDDGNTVYAGTSSGVFTLAQPPVGSSDAEAPSVPSGLTATAVSSSQIDLSWSASADNVGVTRYKVFEAGVYGATVLAPNVGFSVTGLKPSTSYGYSVAACDAAGNCSAQSSTASATTGVVSTSTTSTTTTTTTAAPTTTTGAATTTTTTTSSTTTTTQVTNADTNTINMVPSWNLVGNGVEAPITVASTFNDATKVTTVWKWVTSGSTVGINYPAWAFYTPVLADGGQAYAASKGYEYLTTINAAEGFWVNAKAAFAVALPMGAVVQLNSFMPALPGMGLPGGAHALPRSWSLIATGDNPTPAQFDAAIATFEAVPPAAGSTNVYTNLTTLWAWDAAKTNWYFWAPALVNNGGLAAYLTSKGYLDFATMPNTPVGTLSPSTGVWVNLP